MTFAMFCLSCNKNYKLVHEDISLIEKFKPESIRLENSVYLYKEGCFFKDLNKIKKSENTQKES